MNDEPRRYADDDERPAVQDALRSLRDEAPSDDSRRALLTALGLGPNASPPDPVPEPRRAPVSSVHNFLLWFVAGLISMAVIVFALRWLG